MVLVPWPKRSSLGLPAVPQQMTENLTVVLERVKFGADVTSLSGDIRNFLVLEVPVLLAASLEAAPGSSR